jgi:hypothetical protein
MEGPSGAGGEAGESISEASSCSLGPNLTNRTGHFKLDPNHREPNVVGFGKDMIRLKDDGLIRR